MKFPINNSILGFLGELDIQPDELKYQGDLSSMSNSNYLFGSNRVAHKQLVLRVDNASNSKIIDRSIEDSNSRILENLGIGPKVHFSDGYKISEYITSPSIYNKLDTQHNRALCRSLALLHNSSEKFKNIFHPCLMAHGYLNGLKNPSYLVKVIKSDLESIQSDISEFSSKPMVPCQIDLVPENLIYSNYDGKMYIIDQEYSGMYYAEWDLADLASETNMDSDQERMLIEQYEAESGVQINYKLYYICKALCNLLWAAWALYYDENEGNMSSYFNLRYGNYVVARDYYKEMNKSDE